MSCMVWLAMVWLAMACLWAPRATSAQDWPALRGADGLGVTNSNSLLAGTSEVGLEIKWKVPLGSGYSSVIVADNKVLAMYTAGNDPSDQSAPQQDWISAFAADNGQKLWSYSLGDYFVGKNGSFDGPLATPLVVNDKVYGLSPTGRLFCLELGTGQPVWTRELAVDEAAPQPLYGFTTSPIVAGGHLILQMGATEKALAAFDLDTGETRWAVGTDVINSQTPQRIVVEGREIVLAFGGQKLMGVDPVEGKILFEYEHGGGNGSAVTPVPLGGGNYLLTLDDSFSTTVKLTPAGDQFSVSEVWKNRSIKNTYNIPVLVNDHVFAYSTRILTCVDPATGRAKWKSRTPGDGFLIAVDNHLILSTKKGGLHLAAASADRYTELAATEVFEDLVWSVPAYSDNAIFLRSLGELARVDIVDKKAIVAGDAQQNMPLGEQFGKFLASVQQATGATAKTAEIERFLEQQDQFPLVEKDIVQFVYYGEGKDVAVASDVFGARQEQKMTRVPDTNLFYYSMRLPEDQRANYMFLVDYKLQRDPRNARSQVSTIYAGEMEFAVRLRSAPPLEMSWFAMPAWKQPSYLPAAGQLAGELKTCSVDAPGTDDEASSAEMEFQVYLPPAYAEKSERRYPVAYVFGGRTAIEKGNLPQIADSIFRTQNSLDSPLAPECLLVFIDGPPMAPLPPGLVAETIVPYVDENFRTEAKRTARLSVGFGFDSASALMVAGANPDLFGAISVQSPLLFDAAQQAVLQALADVDQPLQLRVEWGRYDMFNPHENWDLRDIAKDFVAEAKSNQHLAILGGEVNDSSDWSSWQNRIHEILQLLDEKNQR